MSEYTAWYVAALLAAVMAYVVARELVADAWLANRIRDSALVAWQFGLLGYITVAPVLLVSAWYLQCLLNTFHTYYGPYLILTGSK